jgi:Polysaccharide lyase 14
VNRTGQAITVWYDGRQVFTTRVTGIATIPFSGVFFSTFFGGHDRSWGPAETVHASFADFSVSTAVQH